MAPATTAKAFFFAILNNGIVFNYARYTLLYQAGLIAQGGTSLVKCEL
jgi:hypothetical protein